VPSGDEQIEMPGGSFAANLDAARRARGYSNEELARRAGLNIAAIYRLADGTHWPKLSSVLKLAEALEVAPTALIEGLSASDLERGRR